MKQFAHREVLNRYNIIVAFIVLVVVYILGTAGHTMFVEKGDWDSIDDLYRHEGIEIKPVRGDILADGGEVLATSLPKYRLFMDYVVWEKDSVRRAKLQAEYDSVFMSKLDSLAMGLHEVFPDQSAAWFRSRLLQGKIEKKRHWRIYPRQVSFIEYMEVKQLPFINWGRRSGFHEEVYNQTKKPYGSLASGTIGGLWPEKEEGRYGLQLAFDSLLRGTSGLVHRQKVRNRYVDIVDKPAEDGLDIQTTLNVGLQDYAEEQLRAMLVQLRTAKAGVAILMEVETGDIKAMVNLERQPDGTFMDMGARAVNNLMEPGSVFKPMSFMVAFNDGKIKMTDRIDTGNGQVIMHGRRMTDHNHHRGGYGVLTVPECLEYSSNVGVSGFIDRLYYDQPEKFVQGIYNTGVAEDLHLDIPGYAKPRIRMPKADGSNWSKTALAWMSIGYETQVPPISVLNFYNGVANGGRMVRPRLVKAALRNGEVVKEFPVEVIREQMCSADALQKVQTCLEWVVSKGLGKKAGSKNFKVSGKTGTAQVWGAGGKTSDYLISFAGYFPSDKPKYSCIVCILKTGLPASGGGHCGPVFKAIAERAMSEGSTNDVTARIDTVNVGVPLVAAGNMAYANYALNELGIDVLSAWKPGDNSIGRAQTKSNGVTLEEEEEAVDRVPNVVGMGARDAVYVLEKLGLKVRVSGSGYVNSQSLPATHVIKKGETIRLELGARKVKKGELKAERPKPVPVAKDTTAVAAPDSNAVNNQNQG